MRSRKWKRLISLLEQPSEHKPVSVPPEVPPVPFESNITREKFIANVLTAKKYITSGDIIQVVGSQRFFHAGEGDAAWIFIARRVRSILRRICFCWSWKAMALVGASPELHVRCEDHKVEIRPIAGGRVRAAKRPSRT